MTSALVSLGAGAISGIMSKRANKGLSGAAKDFKPVNFQGGGLGGTFKNNQFNVAANENRQGVTNVLGGTFGAQGQALGGLRSRIAPGFSNLRRVRLRDLENRRRRALGDIRENLQKRRVLGSSFGSDALARADAEFAQSADRINAESELQEIGTSQELIGQEFAAKTQAVQTALDELNIQADMAAKLSSQASGVLQQNAQLKEQVAANNAKGIGQFFGSVAAPLGRGLQGFAKERLGSDHILGFA